MTLPAWMEITAVNVSRAANEAEPCMALGAVSKSVLRHRLRHPDAITTTASKCSTKSRHWNRQTDMNLLFSHCAVRATKASRTLLTAKLWPFVTSDIVPRVAHDRLSHISLRQTSSDNYHGSVAGRDSDSWINSVLRCLCLQCLVISLRWLD